MSALATAAPKSFNGKFTAKIDFPIGHFILPLLMLTMKSKISPYIIWHLKYLDHMLVKFKQIVWFELTKILCFLIKKMVDHFWQSVDAIFEDVSVSETNKDYHLSVFQKLQCYNTCNQVKWCHKHGRPNCRCCYFQTPSVVHCMNATASAQSAKFLPANNFCHLLRVTRKRSCTSAGNTQVQLHFRNDQQRAFGISNISN